jgi:hypothetical protein
LLVVDVVVAGLLADFPFAVGGVGGRGITGHETSEDGALMQGEGFGLFRCVV